MQIIQTTDNAEHTKRVRRARMDLSPVAATVVAVGIPCIARTLTTEVHAANDDGGPNMALMGHLWATMMIMFMRKMKMLIMTTKMIMNVISSS